MAAHRAPRKLCSEVFLCASGEESRVLAKARKKPAEKASLRHVDGLQVRTTQWGLARRFWAVSGSAMCVGRKFSRNCGEPRPR